MSKSNPSDIKVAVQTPGAFAGLKALNLQVFVMIAAIIAIMLFLLDDRWLLPERA